jgi:IgA Peptidase M64
VVHTVDPHDKTIDTSTPSFSGRIIAIQKSGDPPLKVDLLFLGEGYSKAEQDKCEKDIRRLKRWIVHVLAFHDGVISMYGRSALPLLIRAYRTRLAAYIAIRFLGRSSMSSAKSVMRCRLIIALFAPWRRSFHTM